MEIITYNGKINCFCCYYNDETNKVMVDLNISFERQYQEDKKRNEFRHQQIMQMRKKYENIYRS